MAYTEYDYDALEHFPSEITCTLEESHSAKRDKSNRYLGSVVTKPSNAIVNVEVLTESDADAYTFYHWFSDTLNGGTDPFAMYTEIFGRAEYYVLEITTDVSEKIIGGNNRKIKFTAEVLGVSYPTYTLGTQKLVLSTGSIYASVIPNDPIETSVLNPEYFDLLLDGVSYPIVSVYKENNILYADTKYPITNYPTNIILNHTVKQQGLGIFSEELTNNSTILRASIAVTPTSSINGESISIILDRFVNNYSWTTGFEVYADGDPISINGDVVHDSTNRTITINLNVSRPLYKYEAVKVYFTDQTNAEIEPFENIGIINNSTVLSPENNELLTASVATGGSLIVAGMSVPKDIVYDNNLFEIELNGETYSTILAEQSAATLSVTPSFGITDYVSTVQLRHTDDEWGFGSGLFDVTNNSTLSRIIVSDAYTNSEGTRFDLILSREIGRSVFDSWLGAYGIISNMVLTADGIPVALSTNAMGSSGSRYTIYLQSGSLMYSGQTLLLSYNDSTDIELAPFTNESITNYSQINESMRAVSAITSTDGLTITAIMSASDTVSYNPVNFTINHGYLDITPTSAEQSGTTLTLALPTAIRDSTSVYLNHEVLEFDWGLQYDLAVTNNSTVNAPEIVSSQVVTTGTYLIITMDEEMVVHTFSSDEFIVKVGGSEVVVTAANTVAGTNTIWVYVQNIIYSTDTVTISFVPTNDPQVYPFTDSSVTNNSTQTPTNLAPPIYEMTELLVEWGGYYWLVNSAPSGSVYNGKLCRADGSTWTALEASTRYTRNGAIDLSNDYYVDTGWEAPQNSDWNVSGVYDVIMNSSYSMYTLDYDGTANTVDVYLYSNTTPVPSIPTYSGLSYTPPIGTWKMYEEPPSIISDVNHITYDMSTFNTV